MEKTVHSGAAKNPRLLKACNITKKGDMGEFFIIGSKNYNAKKDNFLGKRSCSVSKLCKKY